MEYNDLSFEKKKEITNYYNKPNPIKKTCREFDISENSLYKILKEFNIQKRTREQNGKRLYNIDKSFFDNQSSDLAYFLGLMGADGCIARNSNVVFIELQRSDYLVLENLRQSMGLERPIKFYETKNGYKNAKLYFENKGLHEKLINEYGLCPNKTYDVEHFKFPNIDKKYYPDYIRGYFDGDGSIKKANGTLCFQLDSSNEKLLLKIKDILEEETGAILSKWCDMPPKERKNNHNRTIPYYRIFCYGENAKKIFRYLYYSEDIIYLQRKYDFYKKEME